MMKWTKNQFGSRKVVGQATMLIACPFGTKSGGGDCPPSPTGSITSGLKFVCLHLEGTMLIACPFGTKSGGGGTFRINNFVAF